MLRADLRRTLLPERNIGRSVGSICDRAGGIYWTLCASSEVVGPVVEPMVGGCDSWCSIISDDSIYICAARMFSLRQGLQAIAVEGGTLDPQVTPSSGHLEVEEVVADTLLPAQIPFDR